MEFWSRQSDYIRKDGMFVAEKLSDFLCIKNNRVEVYIDIRLPK